MQGIVVVLTKAEYDLVLESLAYTKRVFQEHAQYPSAELKATRVAEVASIMKKLRDAKRSAEA